MLKFLLLIGAAYLILCAGAFVFQRRLIFFPSSGPVPEPEQLGLRAEKVRIPVPDGVSLAGWWVNSGSSPYTLLWCHGNAGCITHRADELADFTKRGYNVLLFDYRGYGESTGTPTAKGLREDVLAAYEFLTTHGVEGRRIVPYGRSLGSGPATFLANRREVAGLILVQPLTSISDMGKTSYPFLPVKLLIREEMDNKKEIARFQGPLLILHGDEDDIVPFAMGETLFREAGTRKKTFVTLEGADHNNIGTTHARQIFESLEQWIQGLHGE